MVEDHHETIYHMCPRDAWEGTDEAPYYPATYAADGFIHCSPAVSDALLDIGNHFYQSSPPSTEWIVLSIDVGKLRSEVRWESPMAVGDVETKLEGDIRMPHVYGTIDRDAAIVSHRMVRDPNTGEFRPDARSISRYRLTSIGSIEPYNSTTSAAVCDKLVELVVGFPKDRVRCQINTVLLPAYPLAQLTQTYQGQIWWPVYPNAPEGIHGIAVVSRGAFIGSVKRLNATITNSTCSDTYQFSQPGSVLPQRRSLLAGEVRNPSSETFDVPGLPLTKCRITVKGASKYFSDTSQSCKDNPLLCLKENVPSSTIGQYGINNGKYCPDGSVEKATGRLDAMAVLQNPVYDPTTNMLELTGTFPGAYVQGVSLISQLSTVKLLDGWMNAASADQTVPGIQTCKFRLLTPQSQVRTGAEAILNYLSFGSFYVTLPTSRIATDTIKVNVNLNQALGCTFSGQVTFPRSTTPATNINLIGTWSPACDTNYGFYYQFAAGSNGNLAANVFGNPCPRCGSAAAPKLFQYNATVAGSFCSPAVLWSDAVAAGQSCIAVGVADYGPGSYKTGRPMMAAGMGGETVWISGGFGPDAIFPTLGQGSILPFDASSIPMMSGNQLTSKTVFSWLGLDSQQGIPCSSPQLQWTSPTVGISAPPDFYLAYGCIEVSNIFAKRRRNLLQLVGNAPLCGAGSCNTYSVFFNGGTGLEKNGVLPDVGAAAILSTEFLAPNLTDIVPSLPPDIRRPPEFPPLAPLKPVVCNYNRTYSIKSVGCATSTGGGLYIASPSNRDCGNKLVTLRSAAQVGPKVNRLRWTFDDENHVVSDERARQCPASSKLAGKYAESLKVGGDGWRWRIEPVSNVTCDRVRLVSLNRVGELNVLSPNSECDGFSWTAGDLDGDRDGQWLLV